MCVQNDERLSFSNILFLLIYVCGHYSGGFNSQYCCDHAVSTETRTRVCIIIFVFVFFRFRYTFVRFENDGFDHFMSLKRNETGQV